LRTPRAVLNHLGGEYAGLCRWPRHGPR